MTPNSSIYSVLLCGATITALLLPTFASAVKDGSSAQLFFNASAVYSGFEALEMDRAKTNSALCVEGGRVIYVGSYAAALRICGGSHWNAVNLRRRFVFPGFIDAHFHLLFGGM